MTDTSTTASTDTSTDGSAATPLPLVQRLGAIMNMLNPQMSGGADLATSPTAPQSATQASVPTLTPSDGLPPQSPDQSNDTSPSGVKDETPTTPTGPKTGTPGKSQSQAEREANQKLGQQKAADAGWTGAQWNALNKVIMSESGWDAMIQNPNGTAAGIAQNIHGFSDGYQQGNAQQQIDWLISYVKNRYGTPENAWQHKLDTRGQYGNVGGWY